MAGVNRLALETSPYLRQHAENPVDWYPYGDEALTEARRRDVPLFVSIGYSACHWCHVMAHESFEDAGTAARMNAAFVCVKVDREERPDLDTLYLDAVQAINGHAGWPLSVFATPDGRPFFGGTYYPVKRARGLPSFMEVLDAVTTAWHERRDDILEHASELCEAVAWRLSPAERPASTPRQRELEAGALFDTALATIDKMFDTEHGGFGSAPKFPQTAILELLLRAGARRREGALEKATRTLEEMAAGGIYDHLGGGFSRYSTDAAWQVPHFEKMLYDQALLTRSYLHAWQLTSDTRWRQVVEETISFVLTELRDPDGGLWSSKDADSEGEEGRYYLWTIPEIEVVLGADRARDVAAYYQMSERGNFEGRNILHRPPSASLLRPADIEACRLELLEARAKRPAPATDTKVLTEWNAMACSVLAEAGAACASDAWLVAAEEIGTFLAEVPRRPDGRYLRSFHGGSLNQLAVATDYAWLVDCFTRLGEATGKAHWTEKAVAAAQELEELFAAPFGGYYLTGADAEPLFVRPRDLYDGITPSSSSVAAFALARLSALTGDERLASNARRALFAAGEALSSTPLAFAHLVSGAMLIDHGAIEVLVSGTRPDLVAAAKRRFTPDGVLAFGQRFGGPLWEGREGDQAYVCRAGTCLAPVSDVESLLSAIATAEAP